LICDHVRPTTLKTRIAHNQQVVRADREDRSAINAALEESVVSRFNDALSEADAVVISDYDKGCSLRSGSSADCGTRGGKPVCLDPKIRNFSPGWMCSPNQLGRAGHRN
jgi:D-beta-D-heptose 7-phosphate kinase/D-beta-D-heptose 1-phosphate adenosyltransferase